MAAALNGTFTDLIPEGEHDGVVCSAAFSPDGTQLAIGSGDGIIRVWDVPTCQLLTELPGRFGAARSVAFGPDGLLAAAGNGRAVQLWHAPEWTEEVGLSSSSPVVHAMAFSAVGAMLATGGNEGTVQVWNMPGRDERHSLPDLKGTVWAMAFAPDGTVLATGGDDGIVLWDMRTGHRRNLLTGQAAPARSVVFAPDGATLAAGGNDGSVRVWDENTGELRYQLPGRASPVRTLSFDPNGHTLAAAGDDGTIRVWDMRTGELGRRVAGRAGRVWSVAYHAENICAGVGRERDIQVWQLDIRRRRPVWRQTLSWRQALKPIPDLFDWYKGNAAAGTLFLGVFLVVKGYVIAKGDLSTALGILQYAGLASVVIAGLLSGLPILFAAMLAFTVYRIILPVRLDGKPPEGTPRGLHLPAFPLVVVTAAATVLSAVFTPWTFMAGAVAIGLMAGAGRQLLDGSMVTWRRTRMWLVRVIVPILVAGTVAAVVAMLYTVWVPHEIVAFTPGPKAHPPAQEVGYVLSEDDGWITILTSGQHQIVRFSDSAAKSFEVCERVPRGGWSDVANAATLWQEVTRQPLLKSLHAAANLSCPAPSG
jgi:WD40 repeat protein